jgi:hypothetical protein
LFTLASEAEGDFVEASVRAIWKTSDIKLRMPPGETPIAKFKRWSEQETFQLAVFLA